MPYQSWLLFYTCFYIYVLSRGYIGPSPNIHRHDQGELFPHGPITDYWLSWKWRLSDISVSLYCCFASPACIYIDVVHQQWSVGESGTRHQRGMAGVNFLNICILFKLGDAFDVDLLHYVLFGMHSVYYEMIFDDVSMAWYTRIIQVLQCWVNRIGYRASRNPFCSHSCWQLWHG